MSAALRRRIAQLERRRPAIELEEAREQARIEVEQLIAAWPLSATSAPLPPWQLREIFGEDFLIDSHLRTGKGSTMDPIDQAQKVRRQAADPKAADTAVLESNDDVRWRYSSHLNSPELFDFRTLVALTRAMLEDFVDKASLADTEGVVGFLQKAVITAKRLATIMERIADAERRVGPVTVAELERFHNATAIVLATFVPPGKLDDAARLYTELLHRDDEHPLGRLHEFERPRAAPPGAEGANGTGGMGAPK